jgi:predicted NBD/HSP70 family sugar kinase
MKPVNAKYAKQLNRQLLIRALYDHKEISRIDLARITNLNKATVTSMIQELIEKHLVVELNKKVKTYGRSANIIALNKNAARLLSFDLQPEKIYGVVTNLFGEILYEHSVPIGNPDLDAYLEQLFECIDHLKSMTHESKYGIIGIGLGVYGIMSYDNRIVFAPLSSWKDVELKQIIESYAKLETYVENEANISVLGERILQKDMKNMIALDIGSGVGMGIVLDGLLYRGHDGYAGEIGHTIIEPGGRACACGNHGCLEQYISEKALVHQYYVQTNEEISFDTLLERLKEKNPVAINLYQDFIYYTSIGINNIANTLNPEGIIIRSKLINQKPESISLIKNNLRSQILSLESLSSSNEKDTVNTLGTSFVLLERFLETLF